MVAEPRTLDNYQQQTKLVNSARLHLSVHFEGNTHRAGHSRRFRDQQHTSSSESSSSEDSKSDSEISSSETSSNSSSDSAELDRHSSKIAIWSRIDGDRDKYQYPQVNQGKIYEQQAQENGSEDS